MKATSRHRVNAWHKHPTDLRRRPACVYLIAKFGPAGYGSFNILREILSANVNDSTAEARYPLSYWLREVLMDEPEFFDLLDFLRQWEEITFEVEGDDLSITYPELFEARDEYARKRSRKHSGASGQVSGQTQDNTPDKLPQRRPRAEKTASRSSTSKQAAVETAAASGDSGLAAASWRSMSRAALGKAVAHPDVDQDDYVYYRASLLPAFERRYAADALALLRIRNVVTDGLDITPADRELLNRHGLTLRQNNGENYVECACPAKTAYWDCDNCTS